MPLEISVLVNNYLYDKRSYQSQLLGRKKHHLYSPKLVTIFESYSILKMWGKQGGGNGPLPPIRIAAAQKLVTSLEIASEYARIFSALTNAIGNRIG